MNKDDNKIISNIIKNNVNNKKKNNCGFVFTVEDVIKRVYFNFFNELNTLNTKEDTTPLKKEMNEIKNHIDEVLKCQSRYEDATFKFEGDTLVINFEKIKKMNEEYKCTVKYKNLKRFNNIELKEEERELFQYFKEDNFEYIENGVDKSYQFDNRRDLRIFNCSGKSTGVVRDAIEYIRLQNELDKMVYRNSLRGDKISDKYSKLIKIFPIRLQDGNYIKVDFNNVDDIKISLVKTSENRIISLDELDKTQRKKILNMRADVSYIPEYMATPELFKDITKFDQDMDSVEEEYELLCNEENNLLNNQNIISNNSINTKIKISELNKTITDFFNELEEYYNETNSIVKKRDYFQKVINHFELIQNDPNAFSKYALDEIIYLNYLIVLVSLGNVIAGACLSTFSLGETLIAIGLFGGLSSIISFLCIPFTSDILERFHVIHTKSQYNKYINGDIKVEELQKLIDKNMDKSNLIIDKITKLVDSRNELRKSCFSRDEEEIQNYIPCMEYVNEYEEDNTNTYTAPERNKSLTKTLK